MFRGSRGSMLLAVCVAALASGYAMAQSTESTGAEFQWTDVETLKTLSNEQRLAKATQLFAGVSGQCKSLRTAAQQAGTKGDRLLETCLGNAAEECGRAATAMDQRLNSLKKSLDSGNESHVLHEVLVLQVMAKRINESGEEAAQCEGEDSQKLGEADVDLEIDPTIAAITAPGATPPVIPTPPVPYIPPPLSGIN